MESTTVDNDVGIVRDFEIAVLLKHLSNFWRSLEISFISCEIELQLNLTKDYIMYNYARDKTFDIANAKP